MPKNRAGSMISKRWVKQTRAYFLKFLRETKCPSSTDTLNEAKPSIIRSG